MSNKITEEQFIELSEKLIISYLEKNGSKAYHQIAMIWNFDNEQKVIDWIIDNKNTDKATALMIYWKMEIGYSKQFKNREDVIKKDQKWYLDDFDLIENIEEKLLSDYYKTQNFAFNPYLDQYGYDLVKTAKDYELARPIPEEVMVILEGEKIDAIDGYDGIPQELIDEYNALAELIDEEGNEE